MFISKEIAAVLLNTSTKAIGSEFHQYVRPTKHPILSNLCKNFTGIEQSLIDRQKKFPEVYQQMREWLDKITAQKGLKFTSNVNVAFCSWTSFDINDFFYRDFKNHNIKLPIEMIRWIDLKELITVSVYIICIYNYETKSK